VTNINRDSLPAAEIASMMGAGAPSWGHCDGVDGPLVDDVRAALACGDATPALKWVRRGDEQAVCEAFDMARAVREQGGAAAELADRYFLETVVRLHTESEGATFVGLRPTGATVSPAIARAEAALEEGDVEQLADDMARAVAACIRRQFSATREAGRRKDESIELGRDFVDEYVQFVHYVKFLYEAVSGDHDYTNGAGSH
jgi:hypothetical protein